MPEKTPFEQGKLIGEISHYFGKIGVAIIDLSDKLKVGDTVQVIGGETDFAQTIDSMEIDHQKVKNAKKGDSVGIKVSEKVREGYKVYQVDK